MLLALGSAVTQLRVNCAHKEKSSLFGYSLVLCNSLAAGSAGVLSEKLLKGEDGGKANSIHWQNMQLYFFGLIFGLWPSLTVTENQGALFHGFNAWAYGAVACLAVGGLLVSFVLKYLDNFAKCFVAAFAVIFVSVAHATLRHETLSLELVVGVSLVCMALEQYNSPQ